LRAWERSEIKGRLVLVGSLDGTLASLSKEQLSRSDVIRFPFQTDIASYYRSANVFVFPSLVEGGPQVTYEAAACGLPIIASPMGSGRLVRHGIEGFVVDPYDIEAWVEALRELDRNQELRAAMGAKANANVRPYAWSTIGNQRLLALMDAKARVSGD